MDYLLQQWRNQHQSNQQPCSEIPKILHEHPQQHSFGSALSLYVRDPNSRSCNLSAFLDSITTRFPKMGGFFSLAQWQELELQALIFKYMLAGAPVPLDLAMLFKKSLLTSPTFYNPLHQDQHYQPALLQTGWGRRIVDAEPGRCRRTDGKKWRCSRNVVTGQKYCERHVHRGRNRSRKPVEIPTTTTRSGSKATINSSLSMAVEEPHFPLSGVSPSSFHLDRRSSEVKTEHGSLIQRHQNDISLKEYSESKSNGRVLRHFFDDFPSLQIESSSTRSTGSPEASTTHLSIPIAGNSSSDFSLKLSTGHAYEPKVGGNSAGDHRANWAGWGSQHETPMGGPLAEALRSSTTFSPTSVLHKPYGSISETSSTST